MDFYKLTNFQLYSIINSRHLDAAQKRIAERELERRALTPKKLEQLKAELSKKQQSLTKFNPNMYIAILLLIGMIVLRPGSCN